MAARKRTVPKSDMRRTTAPPLDFAWKEMASFTEVLEEEPWTRGQEQEALAEMRKARDAVSAEGGAGSAGKNDDGTHVAPGVNGEDEKAGEEKSDAVQSAGDGGEPNRRVKVVAADEDPSLLKSSIKLNNNEFASWEGFNDAMNHVLSDPQRLDFIDLSFNKFSTVSDDLATYTSLRSLYLHGNNISSFKEISKLKALSELRKLTLHGNPIEDKKNYRMSLIAAFPKLKQLDFSPITALDRDKAQTIADRRRRQKEARRLREGY